MVGVINPPAAAPQNNINSFTAAAKLVNATIPRAEVAGGWLGKISAADAAGYLSQAGGAGWTPPAATGIAPPTDTATPVYNTAPATPTVIQSAWTYTNSQGQPIVTTATRTVASWAATTYTSAYTMTGADGVVQTGVATGTANVPLIAQGRAAGIRKEGVAAAAGFVAGIAGAFLL